MKKKKLSYGLIENAAAAFDDYEENERTHIFTALIF